MATYDSASLLALCKLFAKRPTVDATTSDPDWYTFLSLAQQDTYKDIEVRCPAALVGAPAALTTSDSKTFTFGTDGNGYAIVPWGHARIYDSLEAIPTAPWQEGTDYTYEGTSIRIPHNATYSGTLYGQWVTQPSDISAATQPSLQPGPARILLVYKAVELWAATGGIRPALEETMGRRYMSGLAQWLLAWRSTPGSATSGGRWTSQGLAIDGGGLVDGSGASILWS